MMVEVDKNAGFCGGVIRAISIAEQYLSTSAGQLSSLGAIVHNEEELSRLQALGLTTMRKTELGKVPVSPDDTLLIRAHGEPPCVYSKVQELGYQLIDCTCPVVLKLQSDIRKAYARLKANGGQLVIFGKIGHPEVLGLVGQVDAKVVVVEDTAQLQEQIANGELRLDKDIELFSQTTMSPLGYAQIREALSSQMHCAALFVHDTICSQVASRYKELSDFAQAHDIIIFVSGKTSSNGKVLYGLCRTVNERSYRIASINELESTWFKKSDKVGVSGATSTPKWLLEKVAGEIESLQ